ncbi:ferrochelatase [Parafrigoribacterium mesophilum]|uniref:ferrochelatase n=1 Tax=Parafrigoribacterium mesophilum TaxID=433646 RepID=UPI0031FD83A1
MTPERVAAPPTTYDAILLAGFGGPEGQDDVLPFLRNVTRGRGIPDARLEEVATHYRAFGGVSPINGQNRALKAALEAELARRGVDLPVYWGNRNWAPYLSEALVVAAAAGHSRLITITTSAYSSYSSCRQYREDLAAAVTETGLSLQLDKVRQYFDHPGFVQPFIDGVQEALASEELRGFAASEIHILFSTHSIPTEDADRSGPAERHFGPGGAYVAQHLAVASAIVDAVASPPLVEPVETGAPVVELVETAKRVEPVDTSGAPAWSLVYQSRSGPPSMPWLEPDINARIEKLAASGTKAVVIVPLGFVSDHMEVKWDLDTEATETARVHGIVAVRVPTPGAHPAFVSGLIDLVLERVNGTPIAQRPALTDIGPWYDVCRPGCCENVRLGFKPALAGEAP